MEFLKVEGHRYRQSKEELKKMKINVRMSRVVKTRSSDQCRSHHQKMMKHHRSIPLIIEHVTHLLEEQKTYEVESMLEPLMAANEMVPPEESRDGLSSEAQEESQSGPKSIEDEDYEAAVDQKRGERLLNEGGWGSFDDFHPFLDA